MCHFFQKFMETFNGPWGLWDALIKYLQDAELLQDLELLQDVEQLQDVELLQDVCWAFLNVCFGRFKVGLKDLSLVALGKGSLGKT